MTTDVNELSFAYTEGWPTDSMGWVVAFCARRLQEGLRGEFTKARYKVSVEQWSIVTQLSIKDGLTQQALADRFHKSKVAAFHLITKLEEQGLIVRRPNPEDGRSNLIHLTDKGREMVTTLVPLAQHNLDRALEGISSADVESARSVLFKMALNLKQ